MCNSLHTDIPKHIITIRESHLFFWHKIVNYTENNLKEKEFFKNNVII